MPLHLFNYLTREKELFVPLQPGRVTLYVCGPTVYDHAHLGHARLYVAIDVIVRYLRASGYKVRYAQNITDVGHLLDSGEDRILRSVRRERLEPMEIAETYMRSYLEDMDALGVARPNIMPRASAHVPEQIELVKRLLELGYAYEVDGSVYFSVEKFPGYGKLSRRRIDDLEAGARVSVREEKRNPRDFALWKRAESGHILRWPSPWGWGYPGWHVECSAMAHKYLGATFDIHGGGLENSFPHNESEIAQSEAAWGQEFARYWMLVGSLNVNGVKMSKSLGNFLTIKDALKLYSPEAIRFFVLSSHYRSPIDYGRDALMAAERGVERLHNTVRAVRNRMQHGIPAGTADLSHIANFQQYEDLFSSAMDDDFNTPKALAALFDLTKEVNTLLSSEAPVSLGTWAAIDRIYRELGGQVLGVVPEGLSSKVDNELIEHLMEIILDLRHQLRLNRDWARSDALRDRLSQVGIVLEDRPEGTIWRAEP